MGELARSGAIPYNPYYGTVDATPLFLVLVADYVDWTGDLAIFEELRGSIESALRWIEELGDHDGDGYIDYQAEEGHRLINQGWKDSGGAIVDGSGRRARPPVALCEVQGFAYLARQRIARLFERVGETKRASVLRREAERLKRRFNDDFWIEEKGIYAMALEKGGRPVDAVSSNPGQALWTGIVADDRVEAVVRRLMEDDVFSGWGIRTLGSREKAYNPVGYHLGTVWPHDNAIIADGFRRHGFREEACRIFFSPGGCLDLFFERPTPGGLRRISARGVWDSGALSRRVSSTGVGRGCHPLSAPIPAGVRTRGVRAASHRSTDPSSLRRSARIPWAARGGSRRRSDLRTAGGRWAPRPRRESGGRARRPAGRVIRGLFGGRGGGGRRGRPGSGAHSSFGGTAAAGGPGRGGAFRLGPPTGFPRCGRPAGP